MKPIKNEDDYSQVPVINNPFGRASAAQAFAYAGTRSISERVPA